jgi:molybdopterin-guanine dinucleotide biosynthesis protein A
MPLLKTSFLQQLLSLENDSSIVHFQCGERIFPFPGRYHLSIKQQVLENINLGKFKMIQLLEQLNARQLPLDSKNLEYFNNVNGAAELENVEKLWQKLK